MEAKLYAFQPNGHGPQSFFVVAENEADARAFVQNHIDKNHIAKNRYGRKYEYEAWGWPEDYILSIASIGVVLQNDNS